MCNPWVDYGLTDVQSAVSMENHHWSPTLLFDWFAAICKSSHDSTSSVLHYGSIFVCFVGDIVE